MFVHRWVGLGWVGLGDKCSDVGGLVGSVDRTRSWVELGYKKWTRDDVWTWDGPFSLPNLMSPIKLYILSKPYCADDELSLLMTNANVVQ